MDTMILLFGLGSLIGGGLLIWTYTESGKKWLKSLYYELFGIIFYDWKYYNRCFYSLDLHETR